MERINLNHWSVRENNLLISLMRFCVNIEINNKNIKLTVINGDRQELLFNFNNLEEAIVFTENIINNSKTLEEISDKYNELYKIDEKESDNKIILTPDEVEEAIISYFREGKDYRISLKEKLSIEKGKPKISYYLIEHLDYNGMKETYNTLLTDGDIRNALDFYISFYNYELIDFKYIGGVHRVGYYYDEEKDHLCI